jgi:hypothetical protein
MQTRLNVEVMVGIRKTKTLYQAFSDKAGTLYQSHDIKAVRAWIWTHRSLFTADIRGGSFYAKPKNNRRLRYGM